MDHLEDKRPSSSHLDFTNIEPEPQKCFKERALSIGLATECDDLGDRELLSEGDGGCLEAIVGLESIPKFGHGSV